MSENKDYYNENYNGSEKNCSNIGESRVLRGGSWNVMMWELRSAFRGRNVPSYRNSSIGFRLVKSSKENLN